jgi:Co/Zn/Cd efflux system component
MATPTIALTITGRAAASAAAPTSDTIDIPVDTPQSLSAQNIIEALVRAVGKAFINNVKASSVSSGQFTTSITVTVDTGSGSATVVLTPANPGFDKVAADEAVRAFNNGITRGWLFGSFNQPGTLNR